MYERWKPHNMIKTKAWEHRTLVMADVGGGNAGSFYGTVYL